MSVEQETVGVDAANRVNVSTAPTVVDLFNWCSFLFDIVDSDIVLRDQSLFALLSSGAESEFSSSLFVIDLV